MTTIAERRTNDRRRGRGHFRYPERRTGFDRRSLGPVAWYRDRPALIAAVLAAILGFNILDLVLTTEILARGGTEVNPIMSALFDAGPVVAASFKLLLAGGVIATIWSMRRYRRILEASLVAAVGLAGLIAYQLLLWMSIT